MALSGQDGRAVISKQTEIDFGTTPLADMEFIVGDADVTPSSRLVGHVSYEAPTGKDLDEVLIDVLDLIFAPGDKQFTVRARGMEGYVADKFKINYFIG